MTREEQIRKRMNELERQYREARDEKITEELYELARELKKLKKKS
jgi:F0F1-type ATP synthase gamma subunit